MKKNIIRNSHSLFLFLSADSQSTSTDSPVKKMERLWYILVNTIWQVTPPPNPSSPELKTLLDAPNRLQFPQKSNAALWITGVRIEDVV